MKKSTLWIAGGVLMVGAIIIIGVIKALPITPHPSSLAANALGAVDTVDCNSQYTPFPTNGLNVKSYGAKGDGVTDDTLAINTAIIDAALKGQPLIISSGTYMIDGHNGKSVLPVSGSRIYLTNATLKAIPNNLNSYAVVRILNAKNVAIIGGTISGERDEHMSTTGEGGHGIIVGSNSSNVNIKNVTIKDGWGDGLYISTGANNVNACYDTMIHNRRNNASIVGGDHITLSHDNFINATAEILGAGVDIEPNGGKINIAGTSDVTVSDSLSYGNLGDGLAIYGFFNATNNITLSNNTIVNSAKMGIRANYATNVVLKNNTVVDSNLGNGDYNYDIFVDHGDNYTVDSNKVTSKSKWMGILAGNITTAQVSNNCLTAGKNIYTPPDIATVTNTNNNLACTFPIPTITYLDLTPPVVKLSGASTVYVPLKGTFTDQGATALDAKDGVLSVVKTGTVNTNVSGTYIITYSATDKLGNTGSATRTVTVAGPSDTTPPVVTVLGNNPLKIVATYPFVDPGATAMDETDGDLSQAISKTGTVDMTKSGTYTITYSAADKAGNVGIANRTVSVVPFTPDITPPVITLAGKSPMWILQDSVFTDPGATAIDAREGPTPVVTSGTVNTAIAGKYTITYTATDKAGNVKTVNRIVTVTAIRDTTPPSITLNGSSSQTITVGTTFTDPGATATDNNDGTVAVTKSGSVDTTKVGAYTITYKAKDRAGNSSTATRTVTVVAVGVDTTPPSITLKGANPFSLTVHTAYTDPGATATDAKDGTVPVTSSGSVITTTVGTYTITYKATDKIGNTATATRTVKVIAAPVDKVPPVVTLLGPSLITITADSIFTDPGATAHDAKDGTLSVTRTGIIIKGQVGSYTLTYTATDKDGNASSVVRTLKVIEARDAVPPVVTLNGQSTVSLTVGTTFTDPGAVAKDSRDGIVSVVKTGTVDTTRPGTYTIKYVAVDKSNNTASVIRTVKVLAAPDTTAPVLTLSGSATMTLVAGTTFTDPGATAVDAHDGTVAVSKTGTVNTAVAGIYKITYVAVDAADNEARVTRTVTVTPPAPVIPPGPVSVTPGNNVSLFVEGIPGFTQYTPSYDTYTGTHTAFTGGVKMIANWVQDAISTRGVDLALYKNGTIVDCHRVTSNDYSSSGFSHSFATMSFATSDTIEVRALFSGSCPLNVMDVRSSSGGFSSGTGAVE